MQPLRPTLPNLIGAGIAFIALALLFVACPLLAAIILFGLCLVPIKRT